MSSSRLAYPALERLGEALLDDVAVPGSRLPGFLVRIEQIADEHGLPIGTFGPAGDGNLHPTIVLPHGDHGATASAMAAFEAILAVAVELGGTITGEHGVGTLKRPYLERELHGAVTETHRSMRAAFDPTGLLNRRKAI